MKIKIRYFQNLTESKIFTFNIDESLLLKELPSLFHDKSNIAIIPIMIKLGSTPKTVGDYYRLIKGDECNVHFNAVSRSLLSRTENNLLADLHTALFTDPNHLYTIQKLIDFMQLLPHDIKESLAVRLTDDVTMYGKTLRDTITDSASQGEARATIQVAPYPSVAAGATNVVVYRNPLDELYIALVYNQRRDSRPDTHPLKKHQIPDYWKLPEGYMHPKPREGGEAGIANISSEQMDTAEELIVSGHPMKSAYQRAKVVAEFSSWPAPNNAFDTSIQACALREVHEEIGLDISAERLSFVAQREDSGRIFTAANIYLIKANASINPPQLHVDGSEIAEAVWGKLRAFRFDKVNNSLRVTLDYYDDAGDSYAVELPLRYCIAIGQAILKLRQEEIQQVSQGLFSTQENVEAWVKKYIKGSNKAIENILGKTPNEYLRSIMEPSDALHMHKANLIAYAQLGSYADSYHKKILSLAQAFCSCKTVLDEAQLEKISKEGPNIKASLLLSRSVVFSFARNRQPEPEKHDQSVSERIKNSCLNVR